MAESREDKDKGKKDRTILIAVIAGCFTVLAAVAGAFISSHGNGSVPPPSPTQSSVSLTSSPSPTTSNGSPISAAGCVFSDRNTQCASSNPEVVVDADATTDAIGCSYSISVSWGDGSPVETVNVTVSSAGLRFVADHRYEKSGHYSIGATGGAITGSCGVIPSVIPSYYTFTYG
jgi:hypothetical protein